MGNICLWLCFVFLSLLTRSDASTKKGVGVGFSPQYQCTDEWTFNNVHWWYTWKHSPDAMHRRHKCAQTVKPEFVPMINGHRPVADLNITSNSHYVLGFNEPDHHEQSNLTVAQAVPMWKELQAKYVGKVLVSPAVTNLHWLANFINACHGCKIDHVAVHIYSCNAHQVMTKLKQTWDMFHKPIWLTEFACPHTDSVNDQLHFMKQILPQLESAPHVFRYAWFVSRNIHTDGWVHASSTLLKPDTKELSTIGHYYNNF